MKNSMMYKKYISHIDEKNMQFLIKKNDIKTFNSVNCER